jgi:hypothetical protein
MRASAAMFRCGRQAARPAQGQQAGGVEHDLIKVEPATMPSACRAATCANRGSIRRTTSSGGRGIPACAAIRSRRACGLQWVWVCRSFPGFLRQAAFVAVHLAFAEGGVAPQVQHQRINTPERLGELPGAQQRRVLRIGVGSARSSISAFR